jgi:hypothetical protein
MRRRRITNRMTPAGLIQFASGDVCASQSRARTTVRACGPGAFAWTLAPSAESVPAQAPSGRRVSVTTEARRTQS